MNRRGFLSALAATFATPIIGEPEPEELERPRRRVFSFLWDKPLIEDPYETRLASYADMQLRRPDVAHINVRDFDALLKELYKPARIEALLERESPFLKVLLHRSAEGVVEEQGVRWLA